MLVCLALSSCLKETDTTILVNDPQEIPFITEYLPKELLDLFGEENVFFGDQPPMVDMEFKSNHNIYVATNVQSNHAPQPGGLSPVTRFYKINKQYLQMAELFSMTSDETRCHLISPVYLTGHGDDFTAYYYETTETYGRPECAVLFSGTLTERGIRNFRYGYQIVKYNDAIDAVYQEARPAGSIFILRDSDNIAESCTWYNGSLMKP